MDLDFEVPLTSSEKANKITLGTVAVSCTSYSREGIDKFWYYPKKNHRAK